MNIRLDNIDPSNLFNSVSKKTGKFKSTLVNLYERAKESRAASQGSPVIKGEKNPKMPGLKKVTQCFQHLFKTKKPSSKQAETTPHSNETNALSSTNEVPFQETALDEGAQEVEKKPLERAQQAETTSDSNETNVSSSTNEVPFQETSLDEGVQEVEKTPFKRAEEVLNFLDENRATSFENEFGGSRIRAEVEEQLVAAFEYLQGNRSQLIADAKSQEKPIYIRSEATGEYLGKAPNTRGKDARYAGSHLQVNPNGRIYVIPKNPALWLGGGTYKKVRTAIELDESGQPVRLGAFASLPVKEGTGRGETIEATMKEVDLIKKMLGFEGEETEMVSMTAFDPGEVSNKNEQKKTKLFLPYANLGDLKGMKFEPEQTPAVVKGCSSWMKMMHKNGYVNRDIKPANFLAFQKDESLSVKCMDLGLAAESGTADEKYLYIGSPGYMAPEIFANLSKQIPYDSKAADIFALGNTFYSIESRTDVCPFVWKAMDNDRKPPMMDLKAFRKGWNAFEPETKLQLLAKAMMNPDPKKRPDIERVDQILERVYDQKISFEALESELTESLKDAFPLELPPAPPAPEE